MRMLNIKETKFVENKELIFLFILVFVYSQSLLVYADETSEVISNETIQQTIIMHENFGAQVRILQLEKAITRTILQANAVIALLKEKGNDTARLENIVQELGILLNESRNVSLTDTNESVLQFVNIKQDAIALRKEFHDIASQLLTAEDKEYLRQRFREIEREQLQELKERIKEEIRNYNMNRVERMLNQTGIKGERLRERLRNREINYTDALREFKEQYRNLTEQYREQIRQMLREKEAVDKEFMNNIRDLRQELRVQRAELRALVMARAGHPVIASRIENRMRYIKSQINQENINKMLRPGARGIENGK